MLEVQRAPTSTLLAPIGKNIVLDKAHELYQPGHPGQVKFARKIFEMVPRGLRCLPAVLNEY